MRWYWQLLIGVIIFSFFAMYIYMRGSAPGIVPTPTEQTTTNQQTTLPSDTGLTLALVVDMDASDNVHQHSVRRGDDAIIMMDTSRLPRIENVDPAQVPALFTFNDAKSLAAYDKNQNNQIEASDPVYEHLVVVSYHPTRNLLYQQTLAQAGIRAIVFDPDYENYLTHGGEQREDKVAGFVVMNNGSHRNLHVLPINMNSFRDVTIVKGNQ